MGALANIKQSVLGKVVGGTVGEAFGAFLGMVNLQEEESFEEVIASEKKKSSNPAETKKLENIEKIAVLIEKDLNEKAEKQFIILEKDEDSYNKIPDKIGNIGATVSEKKAEADMKQRQKGGKQKTRVDED